jgi:hypothetical protein
MPLKWSRTWWSNSTAVNFYGLFHEAPCLEQRGVLFFAESDKEHWRCLHSKDFVAKTAFFENRIAEYMKRI